MSNKTSDKNVGRIEKISQTSDRNVANEERLNNFIEAYKQTKEQSFIVDNINKDFFFEFVDCLLAEREQDKKRIQELEAKFETYMNQFIPKQSIIDLIENETISISGFECVAVEDIQELIEGEK